MRFTARANFGLSSSMAMGSSSNQVTFDGSFIYFLGHFGSYFEQQRLIGLKRTCLFVKAGIDDLINKIFIFVVQ